ncbi:hypothetical protein CPC08DRAFT_713128 [Agrocybe pediades]|nr:hypothetical protein CPC08DRAFT_713128 [Agrocybe pediades]
MSSHISSKAMLNPDLLWKIFDTIAGEEVTVADGLGLLPTTRVSYIISCSHVCRDWRTILLSSPSTWGKLLVFEEHIGLSIIKEIFSRSQSAPLWVTSNLSPSTNSPQEEDRYKILYDILDTSWDRLERLLWKTQTGTEPIEMAVWHILQRPAPSLKEFSMFNHHNHTTHGRPQLSRGSLFSNHAPLLRNFATNCGFITMLPPGRSWYRELRSLTLCNARVPTTVRAAVEVLKSTPRLEQLNLDMKANRYMSSDDVDTHLEAVSNSTLVSLNHLRSLCLRIDQLDYAFFIKNVIFPYAGLSFQCDISMVQDDDAMTGTSLGKEINEQFQRAIMSHHCFHPGCGPLRVWIAIFPTYMWQFWCVNGNAPDHPSFEISVFGSEKAMYEVFDLPFLGNVSFLEIFLQQSQRSNRGGLVEYPRLIPFLQRFSNIKALKVDHCLNLPSVLKRHCQELTNDTLADASLEVPKQQFPFPLLRSLSTSSFSEPGGPSHDDLSCVIRYLETLDVKISDILMEGKPFPTKYTQLKRFMDEFKDIKLSYRFKEEGEYIPYEWDEAAASSTLSPCSSV